MLIGRTGVGKSSFINTAFGVKTASISHYESCTKIIKHYSKSTEWGDFCLIDTPGLCEDNESLDFKYLTMIKNDDSIPDNISVIYITPLNDTRFKREEKMALKKLHEHFPLYFNNMWIVFTFSASVDNIKRSETYSNRLNDIEGYIKSYHKPFSGFRKMGLVDNVIANWCEKGVLSDVFLCK